MSPAATYIAVVGTGDEDDDANALAQRVGELLGDRGAIVVCGGLGGVMEAACRGARARGGTTVALLPSRRRADANPFVDVAIPTGMGEMRNALIVRSADALIAIGGGFGTLSEIAFALKTGVPVVGVGTWELDERGAGNAVVRATSPEDAVARALEAAGRRER